MSRAEVLLPSPAIEVSPSLAVELAQTTPDAGNGFGGIGFFLPIVAMFLLFYALIIRPQSRQQKQHKKMLEQVGRGDQVVTSGGIHGRVTGISDDVLTVEIADRVRVKLNKSAVSSRIAAGEPKEKGKS
jgi:preprotein translocase subunit YajC